MEQTREGELSRRLRDLMQRLAPIMEFSIKIVERAGGALKNRFPRAGLWEGMKCGRESCITCNQGAEFLVPCTRKSLVYENICNICNKGAGGKDEVVGADPNIPSIYVGETSRTVQERGAEHWAAARGSQKAKEGSHMAKHQELCHPGVEPQFTLRAVGFHPSALSRQTAEAVRIAKRGGEGAVLNSKSEFNRCFIPRLQLIGEELVEQVERAEEEETEANLRELQARDEILEKSKRDRRAKIGRSLLGREQNSGAKRGAAKELTKRVKERKLDLIGADWGMKPTRSRIRGVELERH